MNLKTNNKGFTLIEMIVVLIIIAILAAAAIPSMMRYVSDAQNKTMITEARTVYVAAQYNITQGVGMGTIDVSSLDAADGSDFNSGEAEDTVGSSDKQIEDTSALGKQIVDYAELKTGMAFTVAFDTSGKVKAIIYTNSTSKKSVMITMGGGQFVRNSDTEDWKKA